MAKWIFEINRIPPSDMRHIIITAYRFTSLAIVLEYPDSTFTR
ncbi:MAG: hypothetical protein JWQ98_2720 [Chlorobi bacterium]|nr:hypothetical protein [Chlorobiota bacterium]